MKPIGLVAVGNPRRPLLDLLRTALEREFRTKCFHANGAIDPSPAFHSERGQYHSTELLEHVVHANGGGSILLGVTDVDLFIPILTFVFGEAQVGGDSAIVSYHRLEQEFYGDPADGELLRDRVVKEAVHEVGHILGLTHCEDYLCVMAASHSVEYVDLKGASLCKHCRRAAGL